MLRMLLTLYFIVLFHLKDFIATIRGRALLPFLEVPVTERIDVYLLRLEGSLQSF